MNVFPCLFEEKIREMWGVDGSFIEKLFLFLFFAF